MPSILMMVSSSPLQDRTWDDLLIILTEPNKARRAVQSDAPVIVVEVGSELIDYEIGENGLKVISRMTVGADDFAHRLNEAKMTANRVKTIDVTDWTKERIAKRFFTDHRHIEKLVQIAAAKGIEAALEYLDGTPEEDDEVHRAALRALDDDDEWDKG